MASGAWLEYNLFDEIASSLSEKAGARCLAAALQIGALAQQKMAMPKHGRTYGVGNITRRYASGGGMAKKLSKAGLKYKEATTKKGKAVKIFTVGTKMHRASAPGEAPAIQTGQLTNSLQVKMVGPTAAEVSFSAEYAAVLEFGGAHMAPRPFVEPSVMEVKDAFFESLGELLG